jgi:putative tryptophan/tyrosine transport system substrate-binding protein
LIVREFDPARRLLLRAALAGASASVYGCSSDSAVRVRRVGFFSLPNANARVGAEKLQTALEQLLLPTVSVQMSVIESEPDALRLDAIEVNLDVAVAATGEMAVHLRRLAPSLPIVFAAGNDPIESGLIESYARPNRGATGFTYDTPIHGRRFELLQDCIPHLRRVGIVVDNWHVQNSREIKNIIDSAAALGTEAIITLGDDSARLRSVLSRLKIAGVGAVYFPLSTAIERHEALVAKLCRELGLPAIYPYAQCVKEGGLISYEAKVDNPYAILARQCALVLAGTPVGEIPIVTPQRFRCSVNLEAAHAIRLKLPTRVLLRADEYVGATA